MIKTFEEKNVKVLLDFLRIREAIINHLTYVGLTYTGSIRAKDGEVHVSLTDNQDCYDRITFEYRHLIWHIDLKYHFNGHVTQTTVGVEATDDQAFDTNFRYKAESKTGVDIPKLKDTIMNYYNSTDYAVVQGKRLARL